MAGIDCLFPDTEWVNAWADLMDKACFKPSTLNLEGVNEALEYVCIANHKKMPCAPSLATEETVPTAQGSSAEVVAGKKEPIEKSILVAAPDSQQEIQLDHLYCHVEQMAMIEVNGSSCNLKDLFKKAPIYLNAASLHFIMQGLQTKIFEMHFEQDFAGWAEGKSQMSNLIIQIPNEKQAPTVVAKELNNSMRMFFAGNITVTQVKGSIMIGKICGVPLFLHGNSYNSIGSDCLVPAWLVPETGGGRDLSGRLHNKC